MRKTLLIDAPVITGHSTSVSNQELFPLFQENQEEPIAAIAHYWNQKNRPQGPILMKCGSYEETLYKHLVTP